MGGNNVSLSPYAWAVAGYVSYQATEKLSFHVRAEYTEEKFDLEVNGVGIPDARKAKIFALDWHRAV